MLWVGYNHKVPQYMGSGGKIIILVYSDSPAMHHFVVHHLIWIVMLYMRPLWMVAYNEYELKQSYIDRHRQKQRVFSKADRNKELLITCDYW